MDIDNYMMCCDVERSFSRYKSVLSDKRCNFTDENLKKYFVSYFNLNLLKFLYAFVMIFK